MYRALRLLLALATLWPLPAFAQSLSSNPIHVIVPFPPGAGTDVLARVVMGKVAQALGTTAVVDNRSGAGGIIGTNFVAQSSPDGYTLGLTTAAHAINPWLYKNIPYDTFKDLTPITFLGIARDVMVVTPSLNVNTLQDFIDLLKKNPGKYTYASGGVGTTPHVAAELFKVKAGVDIRHVPYKGIEPAYIDLISGQVQMMLPTLGATLPMIASKQLKPLAVLGDHRSPFLPDVPTFAEAGLPGYNMSPQWYLLFAPAKTPKDIIDLLYRQVLEATKADDVKKIYADNGFDILVNTPEQAAVMLKSEYDAWGTLVKLSGATAQ